MLRQIFGRTNVGTERVAIDFTGGTKIRYDNGDVI